MISSSRRKDPPLPFYQKKSPRSLPFPKSKFDFGDSGIGSKNRMAAERRIDEEGEEGLVTPKRKECRLPKILSCPQAPTKEKSYSCFLVERSPHKWLFPATRSEGSVFLTFFSFLQLKDES